jgi:cell division protein ZapE
MDADPGSVASLYARELAQRGWQADAAQLAAVARLDALRTALLERRTQLGFAGRIMRRLRPGRDEAAPGGIYLWGGVGRGKTWLMDLFHASLAHTARRRCHFHQLMRSVHADLATLGPRQDPLRIVARRMARRAQLWCIDELHVTDIADAMLLAGLFGALLESGVTLVFTSNQPPALLYRDGLQRARFLPAIALLQQRLDVIEVDAGADYRLRELRRAPTYMPSGDAHAPAALAQWYARLSGGQADTGRHLSVNGRSLSAHRRSGGVAWFSFHALCEQARAAADYAELADRFHTLLLAGIPRLDAGQDDAARRFISLIDILYDRGVKLIATAAAPPESLYAGERLAAEFQRTASRLIEMQSERYLAEPHRQSPDSAAAAGTARD